MARRPRRNHSAVSKARVALAAIRSDKALAELAQEHDLHPNQIRARNSRAKLSAGCSSNSALPSAWMATAAGATTCLSSGCGRRGNTRKGYLKKAYATVSERIIVPLESRPVPSFALNTIAFCCMGAIVFTFLRPITHFIDFTS